MKLATGTVLDDRFQIESFLGAGSFGEVYQARQLIFGRRFREVALKVFAANRVSSANVDDIFSDAITLVGLLEENPPLEVARRLVQIYEMGVIKTPELRAFMSMKLVRGKQTLQTVVRRFASGGMPVNLSLWYLQELLVPLAWMHTLDPPVVHGDLKPDNALLTENCELVVLTDFGLAVRMPISSLGGAIAYQAPEKLLGAEEVGTASDVYAVGLMWYEMLAGRHPFEDVGLEAQAAGDETGFIRAHQAARKWPIRPAMMSDDPHHHCRVVPASELNAELKEHPQLEAMLAGCLTYDQSNRYPNATVLLKDVEKYVKDGCVDMGTLAPIIQATREDAAATAAQAVGKTAEARVCDAETLLAQGDSRAALAVAEGVLRERPGLLAATLLKARSLARLKRIDEAKTLWAEARKSAARDPAVYEAQAEIHEAEGKGGLAESARQNASRLHLEASRATRRRF